VPKALCLLLVVIIFDTFRCIFYIEKIADAKVITFSIAHKKKCIMYLCERTKLPIISINSDLVILIMNTDIILPCWMSLNSMVITDLCLKKIRAELFVLFYQI